MLTLLILSGGSNEADIILGPRFGTATVNDLTSSELSVPMSCHVSTHKGHKINWTLNSIYIYRTHHTISSTYGHRFTD